MGTNIYQSSKPELECFLDELDHILPVSEVSTELTDQKSRPKDDHDLEEILIHFSPESEV